MFFVDSNDRERLSEAAEELRRMLKEPELSHSYVAILANKQDMTVCNLTFPCSSCSCFLFFFALCPLFVLSLSSLPLFFFLSSLFPLPFPRLPSPFSFLTLLHLISSSSFLLLLLPSSPSLSSPSSSSSSSSSSFPLEGGDECRGDCGEDGLGFSS
jgi:hypothetical protein